MELKMINHLRAINHGVALAVGLGLLACAAFVLADIICAGSVRALEEPKKSRATRWRSRRLGVCPFTLLELGHVRIDLLRTRFQTFGKALFDVFSMCVMSGVIITIAIKAWPVVERSIVNGSRANTPLETPLAWVQLPWFAGWVWFALMSTLTTICAISLLVKRRHGETENIIGAFAEQDTLQ